MASSQEKYQLILEAREAAAEKIKKLNTQINDLGGPAMVRSQREVNKLERELKLLNQSADKGHPIFTRFTSGIAIGTIAANAAMRAFSAFTGFIKGTLQAAMESDKVWGDVSASLDRHRDSVDTNISSVRAFATEMQTLTGISDKLVGTGFQRLYDMGMSVGDAMKNTTVAMDLAVGKGIDLEKAANLIAKAYVGSTTALKKMGIVIDNTLPQQERMIQLQEKIGDMFGGAAAARMLTTAGKLELLKQRMKDLQEAIGGVIIQSPAFEYFLSLVSDAAQYWSGFVTAGNLEGVQAQIAATTKELQEQERIAKEYAELPWFEKLITTGGYAEERVTALKDKLIDLQYQQTVMTDQTIKNANKQKAEEAAAAAEAAEEAAKKQLELNDKLSKLYDENLQSEQQMFNAILTADTLSKEKQIEVTTRYFAIQSGMSAEAARQWIEAETAKLNAAKQAEEELQTLREERLTNAQAQFDAIYAAEQISEEQKLALATQYQAMRLGLSQEETRALMEEGRKRIAADRAVADAQKASAQALTNIIGNRFTEMSNKMASAMMGGKERLGDIFKGMYQDFLAFFIKQALASIANAFIPGLGVLLGGIFDTPRYDRLAMEQGAHFAHYFSRGVFDNMRSGSQFMRGIVPSASNLAVPSMAAPAPAISGRSTINVTFSGNVLSSEFIERQVAPTLRKLVTNGKSDLALSAENVTGGRNIRVY
jgi:hypothetical protein